MGDNEDDVCGYGLYAGERWGGGSVGELVAHVEARLVDVGDEKSEVEIGERGQIWIRSYRRHERVLAE